MSGMNKAMMKMLEYAQKNMEHPEEKVFAISHCNCPERAEILRDEIKKRFPVKDVIVVDTAGVSSMYANDGGIIIAV